MAMAKSLFVLFLPLPLSVKEHPLEDIGVLGAIGSPLRVLI